MVAYGGVDVYEHGDFFLKQEKWSGTCSLVSLLNATAKAAPALTAKDCNKMRLQYEKAAPDFIRYQFGGPTGWWPIHIVVQAAMSKGLGARRLKVGSDFSKPTRRAAKVIALASEYKSCGLLVLLGREDAGSPNHVIAIRDEVVYDGEFEAPVPVALYPKFQHARRMYVVYNTDA